MLKIIKQTKVLYHVFIFFKDNLLPRPRDCYDIKYADPLSKSGVYRIYPEFNRPQGFLVRCDQETDGGGWTVSLNIKKYFHYLYILLWMIILFYLYCLLFLNWIADTYLGKINRKKITHFFIYLKNKIILSVLEKVLLHRFYLCSF